MKGRGRGRGSIRIRIRVRFRVRVRFSLGIRIEVRDTLKNLFPCSFVPAASQRQRHRLRKR